MTFTVQIDGKPEHIAPPQKHAAKERSGRESPGGKE